MSARYVTTGDINAALAGREADVLDALGIDWRAGRPHITCPYSHGGANDWRWDNRKARAFCTCVEGSHSAIDVLATIEGIDFDAAKVRAAELIGRTDLIRNGDGKRYQSTTAKGLLNTPSNRRDDRLPVAYLAHRLGATADAVPIPRTPVVGLKALGYYDPPATDRARRVWLAPLRIRSVRPIISAARTFAASRSSPSTFITTSSAECEPSMQVQ